MPPVLILLPPSETKTSPDAGPVLDLTRLSLPELTQARTQMLDALIRVCASPARARKALDLSPRQDGEIARNAAILRASAAPAIEVYTGVLFDAIDIATLSPRVRTRLLDITYVQSALFGVVAAGDPIPAYRLSADSTLPRLGTPSRWWRRHLQTWMPELIADTPVLDLRSGAYAAMWKPQADIAASVITARVLVEDPSGARKVVSHHNKATKGRLLRALAHSSLAARTVEDIADACAKAGFTIELHAPASPSATWRMDVVVNDV
jgi:uncharacterized protein